MDSQISDMAITRHNGDQKALAAAKKALLAGQLAPTVIETKAERI